jgi:hypothetical protein
VSFIQNDVSETGFYLRLHIKHTQSGPVDRPSFFFRIPAITPIGFINHPIDVVTGVWTQRLALKEQSIISVTGAAICSKTNFGPAGHHHPRIIPLPRVYTVHSAFAFFFNASWKSCSVCVCSAPPAILPQLPHLCQNGGFSTSSLIRGNRKK